MLLVCAVQLENPFIEPTGQKMYRKVKKHMEKSIRNRDELYGKDMVWTARGGYNHAWIGRVEGLIEIQ